MPARRVESRPPSGGLRDGLSGGLHLFAGKWRQQRARETGMKQAQFGMRELHKAGWRLKSRLGGLRSQGPPPRTARSP